MNTTQYRRKLENQLVTEFIQKFIEKIGYAPTVITDQNVNGKNFKKIPLDELEEIFKEFLPCVNGNFLHLGHKSRNRTLTNVRHIFVFLAKLMGYSMVNIGIYLGNRDHSTMVHSIKTFRNLYQTSDHFRDLYLLIVKNLRLYYESSNMEIPNKMEGES
jgi:chromosomal replication initiation ATPase DnaA